MDNQANLDLFPHKKPHRKKIALSDLPPDAELISDPPSAALISTIRTHGILQDPVAVRLAGGKFDIVAGRRRIKAARACGFEHVYCLVFPIGTTEANLFSIIENDPNQRRANSVGDLMAIRELRKQGLSDSEIMTQTRMLPGTFKARIQIERLIDPLLTILLKGEMHESVAILAARLPESTQYELIELLDKRRVDFSHKPNKIRINVGDVRDAIRVKNQNVLSTLSLGLDDIPDAFGASTNSSGTDQTNRPEWCNQIEQHLADAIALIPQNSPYAQTMRTLIENTVTEIKQQVTDAVMKT